MNASPVVNRIRHEISRRYLTQREVAAMSGLSPQRVNGLIKHGQGGPKTIRALLSALKIRVVS